MARSSSATAPQRCTRPFKASHTRHTGMQIKTNSLTHTALNDWKSKFDRLFWDFKPANGGIFDFLWGCVGKLRLWRATNKYPTTVHEELNQIPPKKLQYSQKGWGELQNPFVLWLRAVCIHSQSQRWIPRHAYTSSRLETLSKSKLIPTALRLYNDSITEVIKSLKKVGRVAVVSEQE